MKTWLLIGSCLVAGCSKKDSDASGSAKPTSGGGDTSIDVAGVNAAIPADLKGKIEFEAGTIELGHRGRESAKAAVPKGWKKGFMPGSLEPADADNFGSKTFGKTSMTIGTDCNGSCEKKDWAAVSDKVYFSQFTGGKTEGKVIKDEKGDNRRTLVFEHKVSDSFPEKEVAARVIVAWWTPDSERYYTCQAEVGTPVKGLLPAFEKACAKVAVE